MAPIEENASGQFPLLSPILEKMLKLKIHFRKSVPFMLKTSLPDITIARQRLQIIHENVTDDLPLGETSCNSCVNVQK